MVSFRHTRGRRCRSSLQQALLYLRTRLLPLAPSSAHLFGHVAALVTPAPSSQAVGASPLLSAPLEPPPAPSAAPTASVPARREGTSARPAWPRRKALLAKGGRGRLRYAGESPGPSTSVSVPIAGVPRPERTWRQPEQSGSHRSTTSASGSRHTRRGERGEGGRGGGGSPLHYEASRFVEWGEVDAGDVHHPPPAGFSPRGIGAALRRGGSSREHPSDDEGAFRGSCSPTFVVDRTACSRAHRSRDAGAIARGPQQARRHGRWLLPMEQRSRVVPASSPARECTRASNQRTATPTCPPPPFIPEPERRRHVSPVAICDEGKRDAGLASS